MNEPTAMSEETGVDRSRRIVRRALRFMNKHQLTEFEFEDKRAGQTLSLSRAEGESNPPLLEGRSARVERDVRSPAPGKLRWLADEEKRVDTGDVIATVRKHDEEVDVEAPVAGVLVECVPEGFVDFSELLAEINPITEASEDEGEEAPEDEGS